MVQDSTPAPQGQSAGGTDNGAANEGREESPSHRAHPRFLPNDIMRMIVENFRLPTHRLPRAIFEQEFKSRREVLRNLCLTAKFLNQYARPLLYETVAFFKVKPDGLRSPSIFLAPIIYLIRTLLQRPDFCGFIKNMFCPIGFGKEKWFEPHEDRHALHLYRWPFLDYDYPS
ncbi:hypothetical protein F5Y06DRAFT_203552 [Hypoxylon sp. FL0890]|nr:hypothetical protein F5Y06DRAFT_203552 [Hypoxylon sp. FL0890]